MVTETADLCRRRRGKVCGSVDSWWKRLSTLYSRCEKQMEVNGQGSLSSLMPIGY